jgi:glycosyltransferase involved in cell wall biosynthesis
MALYCRLADFPLVTVIVPTLCRADRRRLLLRAIDSVTRGSNLPCRVLVVVNGWDFDSGLMAELRHNPCTRVVQIEEDPAERSVTREQVLYGLPAAIHFGRTLVETEFFAFLDDDDEYLPGALETRLAPLLSDSSIDVVVTNGYRRCDESDRPWQYDCETVRHDPLRAMLAANWLASCGGLFRSRSVPPALFTDGIRHCEWTLLAFRLLIHGLSIRFLSDMTFRVYDTAQSSSKRLNRGTAEASLLMTHRMLSFSLPPDVQLTLLRRLPEELYSTSYVFREMGDLDAARAHGMRSIKARPRPRALLYFRHFLFKGLLERLRGLTSHRVPANRRLAPAGTSAPMAGEFAHKGLLYRHSRTFALPSAGPQADPGASVPQVTIIVPTLCQRERWPLLQRAIGSLTGQRSVPCRILVVVDGKECDQNLVSELAGVPGVEVLRVESADFSNAFRRARHAINTEFFGFLNDVDEYLPGALETRLAPMQADPSLDAVITNGYIRRGPEEQLWQQDTEAVRLDPLRSLLSGNWLAPCGVLLRSRSAEPDFFGEWTLRDEWTLFAFRMIVGGFSVRFLPDATFRMRESPGSLYISGASAEAPAMLVHRMLSFSLPEDIRDRLYGKLGDELHRAAAEYLQMGDAAAAWRCHIGSLQWHPTAVHMASLLSGWRAGHD